jgi:hypothetical protein
MQLWAIQAKDFFSEETEALFNNGETFASLAASGGCASPLYSQPLKLNALLGNSSKQVSSLKERHRCPNWRDFPLTCSQWRLRIALALSSWSSMQF